MVDSLETFDLMQGDEVNSAGAGGEETSPVLTHHAALTQGGVCGGSHESLASWKTNGRPLKINGWKMYFLLK